ncbi:hypothetical protein ACFLZ2_00060 [Candidatus Margulisiibacteriota bacterium]
MRWNPLDRILNIIGLIAWIGFGIFTLYVHNNLLPYIYAAFSIGVIIMHTYLYCTRCKHYGENCYISGGMLAKKLFKSRHMGPIDPDDSICASLWLLVALFPIPFLLYYQSWLLIFIYLIIVTSWFLQHSQTACPKCENDWCGLNPNKKK